VAGRPPGKGVADVRMYHPAWEGCVEFYIKAVNSADAKHQARLFRSGEARWCCYCESKGPLHTLAPYACIECGAAVCEDHYQGGRCHAEDEVIHPRPT